MPPTTRSHPIQHSIKIQSLITQLCAVEFDCSNEERSRHLSHVVSCLTDTDNDVVVIGVSALFRWVRHVVTSMGQTLWDHDKATLVDEGAIPLLVSMLRRHIPPTLQTKAANVLTLLTDPSTKMLIWQVNGVEALVDRDDVALGSSASQIAAKFALGKLALQSRFLQQQIIVAGGIESTVKLLRADTCLVHLPGLLLALHRMANANKEAHRKIRACDGVPVIVSAVNRSNSTRNTFHSAPACEMLCALARDHSNHDAIRDANGIAALVSMTNPLHGNSYLIKEQAVRALLHVAASHVVNTNAVMNSLEKQVPAVIKQAFVDRLKRSEITRLLKAQGASDASHLEARIACAEVVGVESGVLNVAREQLSILNGDSTRSKKRKALGLEDMEPPAEFLCPITLEKMRDPVVASDGNSYERTAIELVFLRGDLRSPLSREILHTTLFPNRNLRQRIQAHEEDVICVAERVARHIAGALQPDPPLPPASN